METITFPKTTRGFLVRARRGWLNDIPLWHIATSLTSGYTVYGMTQDSNVMLGQSQTGEDVDIDASSASMNGVTSLKIVNSGDFQVVPDITASEICTSIYSNSWSYFITDHLGTVRGVYEATVSGSTVTKTVKAWKDYEPFGFELYAPVPQSTTGARFEFTGHERDERTGGYDSDYMHFRFYGESIGRFMRPDNVNGSPLNPQDWNLYSYVNGNPVNYNDPTGHAGNDPPRNDRAAGSNDINASSIALMSFYTATSASAAVNAKDNGQQKPQNTGKDEKEQQDTQASNNEDQAKQNLINAQDRARDPYLSSNLQPTIDPQTGKSTTHCNQATAQIANETGAPVGPLVDSKGNALSANQQTANLAKSPDYVKVEPEQAQQLANKGVTVIGAQTGSPHGHVATVRPEGVDQKKPPHGYGPLINQIGGSVDVRREVGGIKVKDTFNSKQPVNYYAPAADVYR